MIKEVGDKGSSYYSAFFRKSGTIFGLWARNDGYHHRLLSQYHYHVMTTLMVTKVFRHHNVEEFSVISA